MNKQRITDIIVFIIFLPAGVGLGLMMSDQVLKMSMIGTACLLAAMIVWKFTKPKPAEAVVDCGTNHLPDRDK